MFYHETAFLSTLFVPCSVLLRTLFGISPYFPYISLIFRLYNNEEITTHYPSIIRARSYFLPYLRTFSLSISSGSKVAYNNYLRTKSEELTLIFFILRLF